MRHALNLTAGKWTYDDAQQLGSKGGFGCVYRGTGSDSQEVAVKILTSSSGGDNNRELEFARSVIGRAGHHVITILDHGLTETGYPCIVMELAAHTLQDYIAKSSPDLREREVVEVIRQVCMGLNEAGDWIHRDLKPANILRVGDCWKIADFGIARQEDAGTASRTLKFAMTPCYAAPEQWEGKTATHGTDVYALGCIAFELLEGHPPFTQNPQHGHIYDVPVLSHGTTALRTLILAMLSKQELGRPSTRQIQEQLDTLESAAPPSAAGARLAGIAAKISYEKAVAEAEEARRNALEVARSAQAVSARESFRAIANELLGTIATSVGQSIPKVINAEQRIQLGSGHLTISFNRFPYIQSIVFAMSGWDVMCGEVIRTKGKKRSRSASLWYASIGGRPHQWVEVAYSRPLGRPQLSDFIEDEPRFLDPGRDADLAAANGMHIWALNSEPVVISGVGINSFIERWSSHFADAIEGAT